MIDTHRKSNWEGEGLTPMITEMHPISPRTSTIYPAYPYSNPRMQEYQPLQQKPWSPKPSEPTKPTVPPVPSSSKNLPMYFAFGILIGVVACGVPLAILTTLYVQGRSSQSCSNSTSSSASSSSSSMPTQCSTYTTITDSTRNIGYASCSSCYCDSGLTAGWYRFQSPAGTMLASSVGSMGYCGTNYPGWYNGSLPSTVGGVTAGTGCVNQNGNLCYPPYSITGILVTNCDSFYVFYLKPLPVCNARYCTA